MNLCGIEHIFDEDSIPRGGIDDEDVCHRSDEFAVLDDGGARHECVQVGTTVFYKNFTETSAKNTLSRIF